MEEQERLESILHGKTQGRVIAGPFVGMKYSSTSCGSMLGPKLLGTYEKELADAISDIVRRRYSNVIDIGAAEGYYAVGLARLCNETFVTAFESAEAGRQAIAAMALSNGVSGRIQIEGHCTADELRRSLDKVGNCCLVICDVEGAEAELLCPNQVPKLLKVDLLVEVHDFVDSRNGATLSRRFEKSHDIVRIRTRSRRLQEIPTVEGLSPSQLRMLACERRPCVMEWFWMRLRHK